MATTINLYSFCVKFQLFYCSFIVKLWRKCSQFVRISFKKKFNISKVSKVVFIKIKDNSIQLKFLCLPLLLHYKHSLRAIFIIYSVNFSNTSLDATKFINKIIKRYKRQNFMHKFLTYI